MSSGISSNLNLQNVAKNVQRQATTAIDSLQNINNTISNQVSSFVESMDFNFNDINIENITNAFNGLVNDASNALQNAGATVTDGFNSLINLNLDALYGQFEIDFGNFMKGLPYVFSPIETKTLENGTTIEYNSTDDDGYYYLNGNKVGRALTDGGFADYNTNTVYFPDGSYYIGKFSFGMDGNFSFDSSFIDGELHKPDGTVQKYNIEFDNIKFQATSTIYNTDGTVTGVNDSGEVIFKYDKEGHLIEGSGVDFSNNPNATFNFDTCSYTINESLDGKCSSYTVNANNQYTYHNADGSSYKVLYFDNRQSAEGNLTGYSSGGNYVPGSLNEGNVSEYPRAKYKLEVTTSTNGNTTTKSKTLVDVNTGSQINSTFVEESTVNENGQRVSYNKYEK